MLGRLLVLVLLYVVISRFVRFADMVATVTAAVMAAVAVAAVITLLQTVLCTVRWRLIARPLPATPAFGGSYLAYIEGLFVNQALPSVVGGDALRVIRWRAHGVPVADAVVSVLLDRMYGVFGAACLALAAISILGQFDYPRHWLLLGALLAGGVLAGGLLVFALLAWGRVPPWLGSGRASAVARQLLRFRAPLPTMALCVAYSIVVQTLSGLGAVAIARSLDIDLPVALVVTVTSLVVLVSMIPISLAGWGVREAGFLAILVPLDVSPERAVLLGMLFGLQGLLASLPGGVSLMVGGAARASD